jgi:hypothetical protein
MLKRPPRADLPGFRWDEAKQRYFKIPVRIPTPLHYWYAVKTLLGFELLQSLLALY